MPEMPEIKVSDLAIAPPQHDEFQTLDLYHARRGGEDALARMRRDEAIRTGTPKPAAAGLVAG